MKTLLSYLLISLVLLQTFSRELLVVDFTLNRAAITARYCVNKARPALHCDGKCYFTKLLKKQQQQESKVPGAGKEKLEMLPTAFGNLVPIRPGRWAAVPLGYGPYLPTQLLASAARGVFHPPQA